jgi:hypothetical protein
MTGAPGPALQPVDVLLLVENDVALQLAEDKPAAALAETVVPAARLTAADGPR